MRAVDCIRTKRDGGVLSADQVAWLIRGYTDGSVGDDQMAAFAMAVFFNGMEDTELGAMVEAMMASGDVISLADVSAGKIDKHSTGGVGDKVSLCLAPLVAACGVAVPMISGRGLGHTGGTLDKLAAIPGFRTDLSGDRFAELVATHGLAFGGQTERLVPADRKLYALRDVTGTVESIPLISASIMSKKLAEGIDGLVLDVKVGSGAFMKMETDARALAETMIGIGRRMGRRVHAKITNMDDVLGVAVGNASEAWEAIEVLRGGGPQDLVDLTVALGATMLRLGGAADSDEQGADRIRRAIGDGSGLEKLRAIVAAQGGDPASLDRRDALPVATHEATVLAGEAGCVTALDVEGIGTAGMLLGAGRSRQDDVVDLAVELEVLVKVGDRVEAGQPWVRARYNEPGRWANAQQKLERCLRVGDNAPAHALIRAALGD